MHTRERVFSPERRAISLIKEHKDELINDAAYLIKSGVPDNAIDSYCEKYVYYLTQWLHAKSRCLSSMITGPSRFPTRRAEKANRSEHNHLQLFIEWRKRALKAIVKKANPVMDDELIRKYKDDLQSRESFQNLMKKVNAAIRRGATEADLVSRFGLSRSEANTRMNPDYGTKGFKPFEMQNNLASIKRLQKRITEVSEKQQRSTLEATEEQYQGFRVVMDNPDDRIRFYFDKRPAREICVLMKRNGFKWSPSVGAWQRQITGYAMNAAQSVIEKLERAGL